MNAFLTVLYGVVTYVFSSPLRGPASAVTPRPPTESDPTPHSFH
jgi:hypothetical protein